MAYPYASISFLPRPRRTLPNDYSCERVSRACARCKHMKTKCDVERPCRRCVRAGLGDCCVDSVHRRRGRKRKDVPAVMPTHVQMMGGLAALPPGTQVVSMDPQMMAAMAQAGMYGNPAAAVNGYAQPPPLHTLPARQGQPQMGAAVNTAMPTAMAAPMSSAAASATATTSAFASTAPSVSSGSSMPAAVSGPLNIARMALSSLPLATVPSSTGVLASSTTSQHVVAPGSATVALPGIKMQAPTSAQSGQSGSASSASQAAASASTPASSSAPSSSAVRANGTASEEKEQFGALLEAVEMDRRASPKQAAAGANSSTQPQPQANGSSSSVKVKAEAPATTSASRERKAAQSNPKRVKRMTARQSSKRQKELAEQLQRQLQAKTEQAQYQQYYGMPVMYAAPQGMMGGGPAYQVVVPNQMAYASQMQQQQQGQATVQSAAPAAAQTTADGRPVAMGTLPMQAVMMPNGLRMMYAMPGNMAAQSAVPVMSGTQGMAANGMQSQQQAAQYPMMAYPQQFMVPMAPYQYQQMQ